MLQGGMEGGGANNGGIRNWKQIEKDSLTWAMRWNNYSKRLHQRVRVVSAWAQMVQVTIAECSRILIVPGQGRNSGGEPGKDDGPLFTVVVVYCCCCLLLLLFTVVYCCLLLLLLFTVVVVVYCCCCLLLLLFTIVVH
jgi:hypothetical protein